MSLFYYITPLSETLQVISWALLKLPTKCSLNRAPPRILTSFFYWVLLKQMIKEDEARENTVLPQLSTITPSPIHPFWCYPQCSSVRGSIELSLLDIWNIPDQGWSFQLSHTSSFIIYLNITILCIPKFFHTAWNCNSSSMSSGSIKLTWFCK